MKSKIFAVWMCALMIIGSTGTILAQQNDQGINAPGDLDFGDAPDTYGTLLVSDGARHDIDSGSPYLGAVPGDLDPDGQPHVYAQLDDTNGVDDEDGINFLTPLYVDLAATIDVVASGPAFLNAWIDYNQDGDFGDAGEQIYFDFGTVAGSSYVGFTVPADATMGYTYARFRLDSGGGLAPTGLAADGEVEDYRVYITTDKFAGGAGTVDDPFQITNAFELQNMSYYLGSNFTIMNDIDASITTGWNGGEGFATIGDDTSRFNGSLEGNDFNITGLFIDRPGNNWNGIFGCINAGARVSNLTLDSFDITASNITGALAGANYGELSNISVIGSSIISDWNTCGLLIGFNGFSGEITDCYTEGTVYSTNNLQGGLMG
ncbi:hypothetical protein DRJ16_07665, partial [Candidatus Woesearchaeota archaeon]